MYSTNMKYVPCSILDFLSVVFVKNIIEIPSFVQTFKGGLLVNSHRNSLLISCIFKVLSPTQLTFVYRLNNKV